MKSPVTPPPTRKPQDDWLQNCGFQSRQDARNVASGILSQTVEKPHVQPVITPLNDTTVAPGMEIFPLVQAPAPPQKSAGTLDKKVTSELRTFRQLSSGVYCPE